MRRGAIPRDRGDHSEDVEIRNEYGSRVRHRRADGPGAGRAERRAARKPTQSRNVAAANGPTTSRRRGRSWAVKPELEQTLLEMGFADADGGAARGLRAHDGGQGRDGAVAHRLRQDRRVRHPVRAGLDRSAEARKCRRSCLAPTRELAMQVGKECEKIAAVRSSTSSPIYGGAPMGKQIEQLKAGAQVVAGTPGRVLDHLRRGTLSLDGLKSWCSTKPTRCCRWASSRRSPRSSSSCPKERQTVLFSATIPDDIERIGSRYMSEPEKIQLSADFVGVHEITHAYYMVQRHGARARPGARARRREARLGDHLLQHARGHERWSPSSCARAGSTPRRSRAT